MFVSLPILSCGLTKATILYLNMYIKLDAVNKKNILINKTLRITKKKQKYFVLNGI